MTDDKTIHGGDAAGLAGRTVAAGRRGRCVCTSRAPALAGTFAALLAAAFLAGPGCSRAPGESGDPLLGDLPPALAEPLRAGDGDAVCRYAREAGIEALNRANLSIRDRAAGLDSEDFARAAPRVARFRRLIAGAQEAVYGQDWYGRDMDYLEGLPAPERHAVMRRRAEGDRLGRDPDVPPRGKLARLAELRRWFAGHGDSLSAAVCAMHIARQRMLLGDRRGQLRMQWVAARAFERCGDHVMTCQAYGELGSIYEDRGDVDSMAVCYETARRLAEARRLPNQAPRISSFYASYYKHAGRLSLAHEHYQRSIRLCREFGGAENEIRYLAEAMRFYAQLGCWDIVEELLERASIIERARGETRFAEYYRLNLLKMMAMRAMATGRAGEADSLFRLIRADVRRVLNMDSYAQMMSAWVDGLVAHGRAAEAVRLVAEERDDPVYDAIPEPGGRLALSGAAAACAAGDPAGAAAGIASWDRFAAACTGRLGSLRARRDAVEGRMLLATGDTAAARRVCAEALARLEAYATGLDPGAAAYLWLGRSEPLRRLLGDLVLDDPAASYGAELYWRGLCRLLGSGRGGGAAAVDTGLAERMRARGAAAGASLERAGATHLLYAEDEGRMRRWIVVGGEVRADRIAADGESLRGLVARVRRGLAEGEERAGGVPPALAADLRRLARLLLPPEVLSGGREDGGILYVTTRGCLDGLPFEALDVGAGDACEPLLERRDVAYLRHVAAGHGGRAAGQALVVACGGPAAVPDAVAPRPLAHVNAEAVAAAAAWPGATLLAGAGATRDALLAAWAAAPVVYLAAHVTRDPAAPFLALVPLAPSAAGGGSTASCVDFLDIRSADLSGCGLVVLSGCSSGVPYVETIARGPGLGDAALDAGAAAVVQTFRDVRDDEARAFMTRFLAEDPAGRGATAALCAARRGMMRDASGALRHPAAWTAYGIEAGRIGGGAPRPRSADGG